MRLLIVTQYFPPEMGAPPARLYELSVRLKDMGHDVTVLTAMPNRPQGRIFDGYRGRLFMEEDLSGIRVLRIWLHTTRDTASLVSRMLCDLSFSVMSTVLAAVKLGKQDVVVFQSPSLLSVLNGYAIGRICRGKIVMWAGDIWPDLLLQSGQMQEGLATKVMYWLERFGYGHSDMLAVTNPGAADQIHERFPDVRLAVWSNGVDTDVFRPDFRCEEIRKAFGAGPDDFLIGYIGLHGRFQGLDVVLDAASQLQDRPDIRLFFLGDGVEKPRLMDKAKQMGLTNVVFHDPRPKKDIPPILASCDASLVPLLTRMPGTMPSKPYEALSSGVPIVVAKGCEAEKLVNEFHVGQTFEPMDGHELAEALRRLAVGTQAERQQTREDCRTLSKRFDRNVLAGRTHEGLMALHEGRPLPPLTW